MSKYKPRLIKHPVKVTRGDSKKIVYRTIRNIQQLKDSQVLGTTRINKQIQMVKKDGICWVAINQFAIRSSQFAIKIQIHN